MKSAKHKSKFTLKPSNGNPVNLLSVSSEGQLLVGQLRGHHLHIYSADCNPVMSFTLLKNDVVHYAVWTQRGNIVYSAVYRELFVTVSQSGDVIKQTNLSSDYLSVSTNGVIYSISKHKSVC